MRVTKPVLILAGLGLVGYMAYTRLMPPGGWGPPGGAPAVEVAEVIERKVRPWHEFTGRLVAVEEAEVRPQVSGIIERVHFQDGALVKKGDLLFTIDARPYEAALMAARARASQAEAALARADALIAEKALSQRDYDQRKSDAQVARAELTRAKLDLGYTEITSPIEGRAGRPEITVGNLIEAGAGAPVLTTVVSTTPIYADFDIDEHTGGPRHRRTPERRGRGARIRSWSGRTAHRRAR
jgi:multidrug efflux system membrane fusion protein